MDTMQNKVKNFNANRGVHTKPMPVSARLLDISSELGELNKEFLKGSKYGTQELVLDEEFKMELGDVLYSLLSLANEVDVDAEEYLDKVIAKYQARIDKNKSMGSGR